MTGDTGLLEFFLIGVAAMAGETHQLGMTSLQFEFGVPVVVEFDLGPFLEGMAFIAFFFEAALMIVIVSVTGNTRRFQFFLKVVSLVAGVALRLVMRPAKRKLGFVVIELGLPPAACVVTLITFFPKASLMHIVQGMALCAFHRSLFIPLIGMATVTGCFFVFPRQFEFGLVVVKPALAPGFFGMALGTGLPKTPKMRIVFFVAIDATPGGLAVLFTGSVATTAFGRAVLAFQDKVGCFVIKCFGVQLQDIRLPSLMVGVALLAFSFFNLRVKAVKPLFPFNVFTDRLVALQAFFGLPAFFKQDVALGALRLVLGVSLDDGTRHQKLLIRLGIGCQWRQHKENSCYQTFNRPNFHSCPKNNFRLNGEFPPEPSCQ